MSIDPRTARSDLAAGHAEADEQRRSRIVVPPHKRDAAMERLLELQRTDPAAFAALNPRLHVAVGHYASTKEAAEQTTGTR